MGFSAGSTPGTKVNPFAAELAKEMGYPEENLRSKSWDEYGRPDAPQMDFIITVCDNAAGEVCPFWPGKPATAHWGYPDPSNAEGGEEGKRRAFELTRQAIGYRMLQLLQLPLESMERAALETELARIGRS